MFDKISLIYNSASLPPRYYRNFTIELNQKEGNLKIENYSSVLVTQNFEVTEDDWKNLHQFSIDSLEKQGEKIAEGATGTHKHTIILEQNNLEIYRMTWDSIVEINENTEKLKETIIQLIKPSLQVLINQTIQ